MTPRDEIDRILAEADAVLSVVPLSKAMVGLMQQDPSLSFQEFERRLRRMHSRKYLVANPNRPRGVGLIDPRTSQPAPYSVWICLHGRDEFNRQIANFGHASYEDNFAKLAVTGVMVQTSEADPAATGRTVH
jgi:hypothetical protein